MLSLTGTVVRRDCTPQSGTRCSLCNNGTFMNQPNGLNKCFPCTSCVPAHGVFAQQKCTVTTDTVCDVLSGYFCRSLANDTGCSLAEKHTHCAPGQRIKEPGTSRTDTVCEDCQPGYFSQDGVNCTAWTIGFYGHHSPLLVVCCAVCFLQKVSVILISFLKYL
uniref:TNFR-Cys domain-containing protein n=1 Tax=Seriola dumerili TaxID=41447 RepID=A0A3B4VQB0_SERDU